MVKLYLLTFDNFAVVEWDFFFGGGGEGTGFDQTTVCGFMGQINPELGKQMCSHYPSTL